MKNLNNYGPLNTLQSIYPPYLLPYFLMSFKFGFFHNNYPFIYMIIKKKKMNENQYEE